MLDPTLEPIPVNAITTAFEWHGGGSSPLYRFASNRRVDDAEHRAALLRDVAICEMNARCEERPEELAALDNLRRVIAVAIDGEPLMTFDEYCAQTE